MTNLHHRTNLARARNRFEQAFKTYKTACRIMSATNRLGEKKGRALRWVNECRVDLDRARRGVVKCLGGCYE